MLKKFTPEFRDRAVRMVFDRQVTEGGPRAASIRVVAEALVGRGPHNRYGPFCDQHARRASLPHHHQLTLRTGTRVFFADPHSPWQRPSNENTNGVVRQHFPKGTDLSRWSTTDLEAVAHTLNNRPRKVLGWRTPAEVFEEQLQSIERVSVATTGGTRSVR